MRCPDHQLSFVKVGPLQKSAWRHRAGFTLIELMVVLALMAVMAAVVIPEMRGTFEETLLKSASREVISALELAHTRAVTINVTHRFRLDPASGKYLVETPNRQIRGEFEALPDTEGQIDPRIVATLIEPPLPDSLLPEETVELVPPAQDIAETDSISFFPDGTAERRQVQLQDRAGFGIALEINPITARVRLARQEPL